MASQVINFSTESTMSGEMERRLAEKLNEEMRLTVLPVTVFVGIEAVFGFVGNMLILYVFLFHYHKCNFKYFVLCLSVIDTTSTLTTLPGEIVTQTFWYVYPVPLVCKIKSFFNVFTVCGCAFGLLVIAIDRYRKVCRPLAWQIKPRVAMILILVQLTISFFIALPVAFFWGTHSFLKEYEGYNITVTVCEIDAEYKHTDYPLKYTIVTETMIALTMLVLLVLYIFVVRKLLQMKPGERHTAGTTENSHNQQNSDITLSGRAVSDDDTSGQGQDVELQDTAESTNSRSADEIEIDTDTCKLPSEFKAASKMSSTLSAKTSAMAASKMSSTLSAKTATLAVPTLISTLSTKRVANRRSSKRAQIRRKTLIMFILTVIFICTTVLYLTLLMFISKGVLESFTSAERSAYFFFFRLYFINHVINPILYGILDPKFRRVLKQTFQSCKNRCLRRKPLAVTCTETK